MEQLDLTAVETEICRLPNVSVTRIVADRDRIVEVHIVAAPGKQPKQIVRDVQSVAMATFGLELDHRTISVVQLGTNGDSGTTSTDDSPSHPVTLRARFDGVSTEFNGARSIVKVSLQRDELEVVGFSEGSAADAARHRLIAQAALDALRQLESGAENVDVDHAAVVRIGNVDVAVVNVVYVQPPAEYSISGSAIVRSDRVSEAIARAVLDATNRRLAFAALTR